MPKMLADEGGPLLLPHIHLALGSASYGDTFLNPKFHVAAIQTGASVSHRC